MPVSPMLQRVLPLIQTDKFSEIAPALLTRQFKKSARNITYTICDILLSPERRNAASAVKSSIFGQGTKPIRRLLP